MCMYTYIYTHSYLFIHLQVHISAKEQTANIYTNEVTMVMVAFGERVGNETGNGDKEDFNYIVMFSSLDKKEKQI